MLKGMIVLTGACFLSSVALCADDVNIEGTADSIVSNASSLVFKGHATIKLHGDASQSIATTATSTMSASHNVLTAKGDVTITLKGTQLRGTDLQLRYEADGIYVVTGDSITVVKSTL